MLEPVPFFKLFQARPQLLEKRIKPPSAPTSTTNWCNGDNDGLSRLFFHVMMITRKRDGDDDNDDTAAINLHGQE
jgi:hypothetical protein